MKKGQFVRIYLDGALVGQTTALFHNTADGTSNLYFGKRGDGQYFTGTLDEVAIYNRALTHEEIRAIHENGTAGRCLRPAAAPYAIRVERTGHGTVWSDIAGVNCGGDCVGFYPAHTPELPSQVTLTATPRPQTAFVTWTGDCAFAASNPTCTLTMTRDMNVGARFTSNFPPWANYQTVTTTQGTAVNITLTGGDPEGQPITFAVVSQPANGVLSGAPPNLTYTPNAGFTGTDSFTFSTHDGFFSSGPATVTIVVNPGP